MDWCVVYNALDDTLSLELVEAFFKLCLRMKCKHVAIPSCCLVILKNRCEYASCGSYGWAPLD